MKVLEFKLYGRKEQFRCVDEAIRTSQFVRNKCLRYWIDNPGEKINKYALNKYCAVLASEFPFANKLNSMVSPFGRRCANDNLRLNALGVRLVDFTTTVKRKSKVKRGIQSSRKILVRLSISLVVGNFQLYWKYLTITDKQGIGTLKLKGTYDLHFYNIKQIKRVRLVRRADGYYAQFAVDVDIKIESQPTGKAIGLDLGLKYFIADNNGNVEPSPKFYRKSEKQLNRANRKKSKKYIKSKKPQSNNYHKARNRYARKHLRVSRPPS